MAAAAVEIEREIQRLEARLPRLRRSLKKVKTLITKEGKRRNNAAKRDRPRDVVRSNQRISVLEREHVRLCKRRDQVRDQLAGLRQRAQ